ncbi:MAG: hypothetical protein ISR99_00560 [Parcubacteria group bacterium]|nr:hypothetical protein [Parcubacteria group bacterium]
MGFEQPQYDEDGDIISHEPLSSALLTAYEKATRVIKRNEIDISSFTKFFSSVEIEKDEKDVALSDREFEDDDNKKVATVLEAMVAEQIDNGWFGSSIRTAKHSRFDDYRNGVDIVAEIEDRVAEEEAKKLAIAIDATYGVGTSKMKISKILEDIDKGELANIKYYQSSKGEQIPNQKMPKFVVGADRATVERLSVLWTKDNLAELNIHPAQRMMLEQIKKQAEVFNKYATSKDQPEVASSYAAIEKRVDLILSEKQDTDRWHTTKKDSVNDEILYEMAKVSSLMKGEKRVLRAA